MARRSSQNRKLKSLVVIFTEGISEKIYFEKLNQKYKRKIKVELVHDGKQGLNAIQEAQKLLNNPKVKKFQNSKIEQIYIVFDKDDLSLQNLKDAKKEADRLGYKIGFSNEAFELWILLHFKLISTKHDRSKLQREISNQINGEYDKTDEQFIWLLIDNYLNAALKNADKFSNELTFDKNPYTNIGWVIKEIYEL